MKVLGILAAIVFALYAGVTIAYPTYTHRYRLTIEIDTPEGVRSGASVIEVTRKDYGWIPITQGRYEFRVRGQGVFVDLGANRHVIALLATGERAESTDPMISLAIEAFGYYKWDQDAWAGRKPMQGLAALQPPLVPTLVTFGDLSDPKTARVVYATDARVTNDGRTGPRTWNVVSVDLLSDTFGLGVRLKRATVQIVKDPVTTGLLERLPWWGAPGRPAYQAHQAMKQGDPLGSSPAENLFERK